MVNKFADYMLGEDLCDVRDLARKFSDEKVQPVAREIDHDERFPLAEIQQLGDLGLLGTIIPEEFGGSEANIHAFYDKYVVGSGWKISYGEAFSFLQLAMMVIGMEMRDSTSGMPEEEVREHFENKLTILKYGVLRTDRTAGTENQTMTEEKKR